MFAHIASQASTALYITDTAVVQPTPSSNPRSRTLAGSHTVIRNHSLQFQWSLPQYSEGSCHWGTWGTCPPQTAWRLWLIVYRTELKVSLWA